MTTSLQQVTTDSEEVQDEPVNGQESLRLSGRFELPHLSLALPRRFVGDLRSVVLILVCTVGHGGHWCDP